MSKRNRASQRINAPGFRLLLRRIRLGAACLLGAAFIFVAVCFALTIQRLDDAYAQWGAAEMLISHMDDHDGHWPETWDDLEPYFLDGGSRVSGWNFEQFQQHIWIDFTAQPNELRQLARGAVDPQFEDGPNAILMRYFQSQSDELPAE